MLQFKSLAIGLLAIASIAPASNAFTLDNLSTSKIPAENLYAQVKVNIGIGIGQEPYPQPYTRERVIFVERNTQTTYYDQRERSSEWRGRKEGWHKRHEHARHHHRDRDDD